jgi:hypothetical protein
VEIKNILEKIVFDEDHLFQLKEVLNQLNTNKIPLKEVKQVILTLRTDMMESLIDLFSFYLNQQQSRVISSENEEEAKILQLQIKEREELLEEIGRRLESITTKNSAMNKEEVKTYILGELDAVEIQSWLKIGELLDFETGFITENYKFLMWLLVCVEKYHKYLFGMNGNVSLPDKIKALHLPKKLEEDFLIFAHNRNMNAHDIVEIPESFSSLIRNGYLSLFKQVIDKEIFPKLQAKSQLPKTKKSQEFFYQILQEVLVSASKGTNLEGIAISLIKCLRV